MNRRTVLLGATAVVSGVAGCSALSSPSSKLSVTVFSHANSPYTIELAMFKQGKNLSHSQARVYDTQIDVDPEGQASREDVATTRPYLIEYSVYEDNNRLTDEDHVHYYPSGNGDDNLAFDIDSDGVLTRR